ncbi:hypothetical protein ACFQGT_05135 [Natrialbaceae archaeon GCM10025810]|uniref:hypothetical protein n=1 Tax=Halovalidus salilacus TaxID=3075124 RepID=UPI00361CEE5B
MAPTANLDGLDIVTVVGICGLVLASSVSDLEGVVLAAALGGFLLSLATWRLYGGRPWEAIAWVVWSGAAAAIVVVPDGPLFLAAFFGPLLLGLALLIAGRTGLLPDIWRADAESP